MAKPRGKLVISYDVMTYQCGLRAGDRVALRHDLVIRFEEGGRPTGKVYPAGEAWDVLSGSSDDPGVAWFRKADGDRCTCDDDASVFETFEVVHRGEG